MPSAPKIEAHDARVKLAFTVNEAAEAIGSSRSAIYVALKEGQLTAKKIGSRTVITAEELRRYVERLPTIGGKAP